MPNGHHAAEGNQTSGPAQTIEKFGHKIGEMSDAAHKAGDKLRDEAHKFSQSPVFRAAEKIVTDAACGVLPILEIRGAEKLGRAAGGFAEKAEKLAEKAAAEAAKLAGEAGKNLKKAGGEVIDDAKAHPLETAAKLAVGGVLAVHLGHVNARETKQSHK